MPTVSPTTQPTSSPARRPATAARERIGVEHIARRRGLSAWLRAARIRQWSKNLLVFAAPAAAGALGQPGVLARVAVCFAVFCLLASGAYLINDARDAADDRRHPVKRHRPVAAGLISPDQATAAGAVTVALGIWLALAVSDALCAVAAAYAALNVAYSTWLRRVAIADIAAIATAFVLRAIAGGVAAGVPLSRWFVLVVSFAALFVAAGKRYADLVQPRARGSRRVLDQYTPEFLRLVMGVACAAALGAYALWAFAAGVSVWRELTIVPFALALLRYGLLVTAGRGGEPEAVLFGDRFTQATCVAWIALFALGVG